MLNKIIFIYITYYFSPGYIETNFADAGVKLPPEAMKALLDNIVKLTPLKRAGEPLDIAKGVAFLASTDAQFITGTNLVIDGGIIYNMPGNLFGQNFYWVLFYSNKVLIQC